MPSTIPYDPSVLLAGVIHESKSRILKEIAEANAPADAAQDNLNALLSLRHSLDMTRLELRNLGVNLGEIDATISETNADVSQAAADYATARINSSKAVQKAKKTMPIVNIDYESPVDFMKIGTKSFPFAADSITMDVQYFSLDKNAQDSRSFASDVSSYVGASVSVLSESASVQMSATVAKNLNHQAQTHSLEGTLVISVTCTHRNTLMLAPFVLNVDKGIRVWNKMFKDDLIKMDDPAAVAQIAAQDETGAATNTIDIVSGVSYGSSFVGMVHILDSTSTDTSQKMQDVASSLQAQMSVGSWFENAKGGFGVADDVASSVKSLLSSQNVTSHVTVITMGLIPSIVASKVDLAVAQFSNFSPDKEMQQIAQLSGATEAEQKSVAQSASEARTGGQMVSLQAATIQSVLDGVGKLDDKQNAILDINSMMTALDDYLKRAPTQTGGVPINYFIKSISKAQLAQMWVAKYFPGNYLTFSNDDSTNQSSGASDTPSAQSTSAAAAGGQAQGAEGSASAQPTSSPDSSASQSQAA